MADGSEEGSVAGLYCRPRSSVFDGRPATKPFMLSLLAGALALIFHKTLLSFSRSRSALISTISCRRSIACARPAWRYHITLPLTVFSVCALPSSSRCSWLLAGSSTPSAVAHRQMKLFGLPYFRSRRIVSVDVRTDSVVLSKLIFAFDSC